MKKYDHFARFTSDTPDHEMKILLDQGVYRHLRFKKPGTGMYFFDIITWPGNLTCSSSSAEGPRATSTRPRSW